MYVYVYRKFAFSSAPFVSRNVGNARKCRRFVFVLIFFGGGVDALRGEERGKIIHLGCGYATTNLIVGIADYVICNRARCQDSLECKL